MRILPPRERLGVLLFRLRDACAVSRSRGCCGHLLRFDPSSPWFHRRGSCSRGGCLPGALSFRRRRPWDGRVRSSSCGTPSAKRPARPTGRPPWPSILRPPCRSSFRASPSGRPAIGRAQPPFACLPLRQTDAAWVSPKPPPSGWEIRWPPRLRPSGPAVSS